MALFGQSKNEVALRQDVDSILAHMTQLVITNTEEFTQTGEFLQGIKGKQKEVKDYFEPRRAAAEAAKQKVMADINSFKHPLEKAERIVKEKLGDYRAEQDRKRREEEQKRLAELKAQEEERLLNEAEDTGDDSFLDDEIMIPQPQLETEIPAMRGVSFTTVWRFQITDVNQIPRSYMIPDDKKLANVVKALKDQANIPGIRVYSEQQVGARSA